MTAEDDKTAIRALIDDFAKAVRAGDIDAIMSIFAPEVVSFDLTPPLHHGSGDFRRRWQALFDAWQGPVVYEIHQIDIAVGGDIAFSHSLNKTAGTTRDGRDGERWVRWTACFRKIGGRWQIVHEHVSVPAYPGTGKAALDLKP